MFGKLVPVPSGAVIPERDIGKRPILNCINLGVTFGGLKAVDDFNLMIGRTEIAGLIGPNGAGKTTVFNLLTKVYQPTHGTILLDRQDTHNMTTAQVNRAGIARTFPPAAPPRRRRSSAGADSRPKASAHRGKNIYSR